MTVVCTSRLVAVQLYAIAELFLRGIAYSVKWTDTSATVQVNEKSFGDQRRIDLFNQALSLASPTQINCRPYDYEIMSSVIAQKTAELHYGSCELKFDGAVLTVHWPPFMINHHASQIKWEAINSIVEFDDL